MALDNAAACPVDPTGPEAPTIGPDAANVVRAVDLVRFRVRKPRILLLILLLSCTIVGSTYEQ